MMTTVDGFPIQVCDTGPEKGSVVVLLCAAERALTAYEAVCERLHTASLRTIVVGPDPRPARDGGGRLPRGGRGRWGWAGGRPRRPRPGGGAGRDAAGPVHR